MTVNNMSNINVSPDVLSTLMLLHQSKLQQQILHGISRSSRPGVFCKKAALKTYAKFTGKHLCLESPFNKVAGIQACNFIKKKLQYRCFPVNLATF